MPRFSCAGRSLNRSGKPTERKPGARSGATQTARSPARDRWPDSVGHSSLGEAPDRPRGSATRRPLRLDSGGPPASAAGPGLRRHTAQAATEATRIGSHNGRNRPTPPRGPRWTSIGPPGKTGNCGPTMGRGHDRDQPSSDHPTTPGWTGQQSLPPGVSSSTTRPIGSYAKHYNSSKSVAISHHSSQLAPRYRGCIS